MSLQLERLESVLRGTGPLNRRYHHNVGEERGATTETRPFRPRLVFRMYIPCTIVRQLASPLRVHSAEVVLRNGLRTGAAARVGAALPLVIGQLSVCSLHQIRRRVPVPQ